MAQKMAASISLFFLFLLTTLLLSSKTLVDGLAILSPSPSSQQQHTYSRRIALLTAVSDAALLLAMPSVSSAAEERRKYQRYPSIRFIAALGDPASNKGTGAESWGLWRDDPGPRGVYLRDYEKKIAAKNNIAPAGWTFNPNDWWVEEHGLIMSTPEPLLSKNSKFQGEASISSAGEEQIIKSIPEKRYIVTGDREITTILTVRDDGSWELEKGTLYDVTHLPCRSAAYRGTENTCMPGNANSKDFPVRPGADMPKITGCEKLDYAVLFVLGEAV